MHENPQAGASINLALGRRRQLRFNWLLVLGIVLAVAGWSAWGTGFNIPKLLAGGPAMYNFGRRLFPPNLEFLEELGVPLIETLQIALLGTTIPIFFALPLALLTAVNMAPNPVLGAAVRVLLHILRSVPELLWAMLLVAAVGLGTFPGVLALVLHTTGGLGKFFYEAVEAVDPGVIEAMEATGAGRFKVIWFGIIPSLLPILMSITLYYWEYNNRAATVLGLVGAGGIGLVLIHAIEDFRYPDAITCVILIVVIVTVIDRLSAALRARVI